MLRRFVNDYFSFFIYKFKYVLYGYIWDLFVVSSDVVIFFLSIVFDCYLINKYIIRIRFCFYGI